MIYHWLEGLSYASVPESELVVMGKKSKIADGLWDVKENIS
jgi:hypothetical protein